MFMNAVTNNGIFIVCREGDPWLGSCLVPVTFAGDPYTLQVWAFPAA